VNVGPSSSFPEGRLSRPGAPDRRRLRRIVRNPGVIGLVLAAVFLSILPLRDSEAIVNGSVVTSSPSWISIIFRGSGNLELCSGVLISDNLILSARHCGGLGLDSAVIGSADLNLAGGSRRGIKSFEGYSGGDDIGVFVLNQQVDEKPIALSSRDIHLNPQVVELFGYGLHAVSPPQIDFMLRSAKGMSAECSASYKPQMTESEFCLLPQAADQGSCSGDSGGPIVAQDGTLGAILTGDLTTGPAATECMGNLWTAVSVTTAPVRTWVAEMIDKYEVNDEL